MKSRIRRRTTKQAAALVDKNPTAAKAKRPDWGDTSKFFPDSGFEYSAPEFHNEFHVDPELIKQLEADGLALQWTAHEIYGAPLTRQVGQAQQAGWVPVARGDLGGKLDYLAPEVGLGDAIVTGGQTLMCRPLAIHEKARAAERRAAMEPLAASKQMLIEGVGVPGGDHPTARGGNRINVTRERIEVPE